MWGCRKADGGGGGRAGCLRGQPALGEVRTGPRPLFSGRWGFGSFILLVDFLTFFF